MRCYAWGMRLISLEDLASVISLAEKRAIIKSMNGTYSEEDDHELRELYAELQRRLDGLP